MKRIWDNSIVVVYREVLTERESPKYTALLFRHYLEGKLCPQVDSREFKQFIQLLPDLFLKNYGPTPLVNIPSQIPEDFPPKLFGRDHYYILDNLHTPIEFVLKDLSRKLLNLTSKEKRSQKCLPLLPTEKAELMERFNLRRTRQKGLFEIKK